MNVPFIDLATQYKSLKPEIDHALNSVLTSGSFIGGEEVKTFERNFADLCGVTECVGLGNATDGLFLALKALGVGSGDEVITPAWSWISSAEVISLSGATPVFADVDAELFTITQKEIESKITSKTKAVIVVHLCGQMAEVTPIKELCDQRNLFLIEDCSQAHLSDDNGVRAGSIGDCGVFSFYPTKNMGAYGDAGCLVTSNYELATKVRRLANHGGLHKDEHLFEGTNSRLDSLQAVILNVKLKHLTAWTKKRIANAQLYKDNLKDEKSVSLPIPRQNTVHSFHLFVIMAKDRDELRDFLEEKGVQTIVHYPKALPFEPAYTYLKHSEDDFPVSAGLQKSVLSLPIHPELTEDQINYVCGMIRSFYGRK
ncbi:MAG: DegT/DnrJ/EryC1/StrS family aminotransferase [Cyclobacteriaceae bacterium]